MSTPGAPGTARAKTALGVRRDCLAGAPRALEAGRELIVGGPRARALGMVTAGRQRRDVAQALRLARTLRCLLDRRGELGLARRDRVAQVLLDRHVRAQLLLERQAAAPLGDRKSTR